MNSQTQRTTTQHSGMTFVELLIAMLGMVVVIGGLTTVFMSQSRMSVSEEELIDLQMNLRVATDRLTQILRHAGFGTYDSFSHNQSLESINTFISDINTDSLTIVYGFRQIGQISRVNRAKYEDDKECEFRNYPNDLCGVRCSGDSIRLMNISTPSISTFEYSRYISFFPNIQGNSFYYVDSLGNPIKINESINFITCSDVYMISPAKIHLNNGKLYNQIFTYQNPSYTAPEQYWIIAENIEDMQFQYSLDGKTWMDDPVGSGHNPQDIRMIRFWLLGKSVNPVKEPSSQVFEVRDLQGNVDDPGEMCVEIDNDAELDCVMYRTGPFNDGYLRMLSRSEVVLRNAR